jgi:hypothetical protein
MQYVDFNGGNCSAHCAGDQLSTGNGPVLSPTAPKVNVAHSRVGCIDLHEGLDLPQDFAKPIKVVLDQPFLNEEKSAIMTRTLVHETCAIDVVGRRVSIFGAAKLIPAALRLAMRLDEQGLQLHGVVQWLTPWWQFELVFDTAGRWKINFWWWRWISA